jgi:hypothetical protein
VWNSTDEPLADWASRRLEDEVHDGQLLAMSKAIPQTEPLVSMDTVVSLLGENPKLEALVEGLSALKPDMAQCSDMVSRLGTIKNPDKLALLLYLVANIAEE